MKTASELWTKYWIKGNYNGYENIVERSVGRMVLNKYRYRVWKLEENIKTRRDSL